MTTLILFKVVRSMEWCEMFLFAAQKDNIVFFFSKSFLGSDDSKVLF